MFCFGLMHPYNTLNVPQAVKSIAIKKDNNNKYLTFNSNFNILRFVQTTWTGHNLFIRSNIQFWNYESWFFSTKIELLEFKQLKISLFFVVVFRADQNKQQILWKKSGFVDSRLVAHLMNQLNITILFVTSIHQFIFTNPWIFFLHNLVFMIILMVL